MFGGLGRLKQFAEQAVVLASETVQQAENAIDRVADSVPLAGTTSPEPQNAPQNNLAGTPPHFLEGNGHQEPKVEEVNGVESIPSVTENEDNDDHLSREPPHQEEHEQQEQQATNDDSKLPLPSSPTNLPSPLASTVRATDKQEYQEPRQPQQSDESEIVVIKTAEAAQGTADGEALLRAEKAEALARKLSRVVKIRELQLEKQALESSELQVSNTNFSRIVEQLQTDIANLEKEKKHQATSMEQLQQQVRDAQQERNQLRRMKDQTEGSLGLLVAKDEQIAAVLKEGEILSKKQGLQVESIRRLRKELSDKEKEKEELKTTLGTAQSRVESLEEQLRQAQASDAKRADLMMTQTAQV